MKAKAAILIIVYLISQNIAFAKKADAPKRFVVQAKQNGLKRVFDTKYKRMRYHKDQIIVKFKAKTPASTITRFALQKNLILVSQINPNTYVFKAPAPTTDEQEEEGINALVDYAVEDEASTTDESNKDVDFIDIDEYKDISTHAGAGKKKTSVSLFGDQWYLKGATGGQTTEAPGGINADKAWAYTKGKGVKVAVIDTGFDLGHPDINYAGTGYDVIDDKASAEAPSNSSENHATSVAGIIAAKDNQSGTLGVAPEAQIVPIRLLTSDNRVSVSQIIAAHYKAVELGAQIINNSWGSFDPNLVEGSKLNLTEAEEELYNYLATTANNGKGVLVIFASGNSGKSNFDNSPEARFETNLAVGATDINNTKTSYSVYGSELDLVAPGGDSAFPITTTDRRDRKIQIGSKLRRYVLGYSKGDYATNFKGTSAAAPVVAGVAALVLAANPDLTSNQLKEILYTSARKDLNPTYQFDASGKNNEIGHGIVDAELAVETALKN